MPEMLLRKSGMGSYDICPLSFKYQFMLHLPSESGPEAKIGTFAHDQYDAFFDRINIDDMNDILRKYSKEVLKQYLRSKLPIGTGHDYLYDNFIDWQMKLWDSYSIDNKHLFWPKYKEVKMTTDVMYDVGGYEVRFSGTADTIYLEEDGSYVIIDYKTGKFRKWMISKLRRDNVMYSFLLKSTQDISATRHGCLFTRYEVTDERQLPLHEVFKNASVNAWRRKIKQILKAIEEDTFPRKISLMCNYCNYPEMCLLE